MQHTISISQDDLVKHLKLSCQIPQIIEGIVAHKIIMAIAEAEEIAAEPEELQEAADSLRLTNNLRQVDETLAWLRHHHLTIEEFETISRTSVITTKLAKHLLETQIEPFFWEHRLEYIKAVIYELILEDEDLVQELYYSLQEGEASFSEIARQYIQEPEKRRLGGFRGIVSRQELRPEIAAAVFAASPPQLIAPITSPLGTHLILVEEIIQPILDKEMRDRILSHLFTEWLKGKIKQAEVSVNLSDKSYLPQQSISTVTIEASM